MTDRRIRLAEAMGWRREMIGTEYCWRNDEGGFLGMCPNPFTNDADCMALIGALNKIGYFVYIAFRAGAALVEIKKSDGSFVDDYAGDDYKQGVCELADKAIAAQEVDDG